MNNLRATFSNEQSDGRVDNKTQEDVVIIDCLSINLQGNQEFEIDVIKLNRLLDNIKETGSLWLLMNHIRWSDILNPYGFAISEHIINQKWYLRNIITWFIPNIEKTERLNNRYIHIYFFVKNFKNYYFNKDLIREKHIWKGVEWGKREDRYNPLGKDPGNLWLMTEDDGKGKIIQHVPLSIDAVLHRIKLVACPDNGEINIYSNKNINSKLNIFPIEKIIKKNKHVVQKCEVTTNSKLKKNEELIYKVINRTSEHMIDLDNEAVDLIVTSPPYWDLKNYAIQDQIGFSETYEIYLTRLGTVFQECFRVLNSKGSFWLNINNKMYKNSLMMIQYDFIKLCAKIGFKLWDVVIWHKSVSGPAPANNLTDKFEFVLVFYKESGFYFNKQYEFEKCDYLISALKSMGNVWNINRFWGTIGKNYPHPAMFPDELIKRIVEFGSIENDLILDPFLGSGTTLIVAKQMKRSCVGYEINSDYFHILKKRIFEENLENLFDQDKKVQFIN